MRFSRLCRRATDEMWLHWRTGPAVHATRWMGPVRLRPDLRIEAAAEPLKEAELLDASR
jgi:hypothetical protein